VDYGIIFDMDGVITQSEYIHSSVEAELFRPFGIHLDPEEITARFSGVSNREMFPILFQEHGITPSVDVATLERKKCEMACAYVKEHGVKPVLGSLEFIRALKKKGLRLAVASGSAREFIHVLLTAVGIIDTFDALISSDEVSRGKPAPDVFLGAASLLKLQPSNCLVIEDAHSGILAAKAAKMRCIGIQGNPPSRQDLRKADLVVPGFSKLSPDVVLELLRGPG
jgi:HAD superfamily hydrolase (TIGR01509 family)